MRDAEALLLVDDEQAEILEADVLLQELVCADDEIDLASAQIVERFLLLIGRAEAREHVDRHREGAEAARCRDVMLLGQNGGRHQNGDLLAVENALHRRAQRDFGLAEAHVAAEQPVHRRGRLHVVLDLVDAAELIVRFGVFKALLELLLPR